VVVEFGQLHDRVEATAARTCRHERASNRVGDLRWRGDGHARLDASNRFGPGAVAHPGDLRRRSVHPRKLDFPAAIADCAAALDAVAGLGEVSGTPGVIGFCLGGTLAWAVAMAGDPAVCVSYYGSGVPSMLDGIDAVSCPTLFHFGNADAYIPNEGVEAVNAAIDGRAGFVLNVENAGHAFDNHESAMFWNESAAQAAWAKTMAFLGEHLPVS
jgi:carboxymethylenebutenolidase